MEKNINDFNLEDFELETIKKIETSSSENVYDIEIEDDHYYYLQCIENDSEYIVSHNSAQIILGDPDDYLFIRAKRWDLGNIPNWRGMSNNTIYADDFSHITSDIWEGFKGNGEPYGFLNLPLSQKFGRLGEKIKDNCEGVNPCLTGDTNIYVADGRGMVSIKELTKAGMDVPVFCLDNNKQVSIKTMRNPRITQNNVPILKILFDNGYIVRCTDNHKFLNTDHIYIKIKDCKIGDSLFAINNNINTSLKIISITADGVENVYNGTVDEYHNYFVGIIENNTKNIICINSKNCGEIVMSDKETCNLAELYLNNIQSKEELCECARLLYKTQKAINAMNFIHEETTKIVHKNMRIGMGVTGICQSFNKLEWLDDCYKMLREYDKNWSKENNWNESIKLTTCKPSGTLSLLGGSTPGIHPAYSKYYIRRIRIASSSDLVNQCRELGYETEYVKNFDGTDDYKTIIVEFPCYAGENAIIAKDMTAIAQLELVKKLLTLWADNSISVTVYYKKEELDGIKDWLKHNYKDSIKSVSFLLHNEHGFKQAPYEEITKEKYEQLIKNIKPMTKLNDNSNELLEGLECVGGVCPIR